MDPIEKLYQRMRALYDEREWAQFHSPKNLVMALASEMGELIEHFRFLSEAESAKLTPHQREEVAEEIGDVFIIITHLAKKLGIDPVKAAEGSLDKIVRRYPADKARGRRDKYSTYSCPG